MTNQRATMTYFKLAAINVVIVLGSLGIAYLQWPEAVKNSGFGSGGYNQGIVGTLMLAALMAGIPIIIFAVAANLTLSWLLFRTGELEEYKARKLIAGLKNQKDTSTNASKLSNHDFAD